MLDRQSRSLIERELGQIARLMRDYSELLTVSDDKEPELIARTALSAVLQSFYNGVESIFQIIAKRLDQDVPVGTDWHRRLLAQMAQATAVRPPLITSVTADHLEAYLGFRHLARHTYSFTLEWTRMAGLVRDLKSVWAEFHADIQAFLDRQEDSRSDTASG
jgi:hypothetical protein